MIKKIVHIADLHFRNFQRLDEIKSVCERFLYDMKDVEKPDRIVITGDVVHSKNQISPELVNIVSWFLKECADTATTIVTLGNHDFLDNNRERMDSLTPIINSLNHPNLHFYKESGVHVDENVQWAVYSLLDGNVRPEDLDVASKNSIHTIGLFHGIVYGMKGDNGFAFSYGTKESSFKGCDLVLCGDIHLRQVIHHGNIPIIMVGSLVQQGYGESISHHGYCVVEHLDNSKYSYRFVDIDNPVKHMVFKITDYEDIFNNMEILMNE